MSASKPPKRAPSGDYGVGYARPPEATQFQPGSSGNRAGRPKGRPSLNEIILEEAARIAKVRVGEKVLHIDKDRALMRRLFDLGLHGNVPALRFAMSLLAQAQAEHSDTADSEAPLTEERTRGPQAHVEELGRIASCTATLMNSAAITASLFAPTRARASMASIDWSLRRSPRRRAFPPPRISVSWRARWKKSGPAIAGAC